MNPGWLSSLEPAERIAEAQSRIGAMIDNMMGLLHLHEANEALLFSGDVSSHLHGHALHGFRVLSASLLRSEISGLCTFWDSPSGDRNSLPSVARLLDDDLTLDLLHERTRQRHLAVETIANIRAAGKSDLLSAVRDFRDGVLAHSLNPKARKSPHLKIKFGDERKLLESTLRILDAINLSVRMSDFDWEGTRRMAKRNIEAFWSSFR